MKITREYGGHEIVIGDETAMRFSVRGPLINNSFDNFDLAKMAIDDATKKNEAQTRRRIAVKVYDERGGECTITGIHAGNGSVLGCSGDFYPAVPWVKDALANLSRLRTASIKLQHQLSPYKTDRYSITQRPSRPHDELVNALLRVIEKTTDKAKANEPVTATTG